VNAKNPSDDPRLDRRALLGTGLAGAATLACGTTSVRAQVAAHASRECP